ncbi:hypothetical protein T10_10937, partial [Trichinella papuae]
LVRRANNASKWSVEFENLSLNKKSVIQRNNSTMIWFNFVIKFFILNQPQSQQRNLPGVQNMLHRIGRLGDCLKFHVARNSAGNPAYTTSTLSHLSKYDKRGVHLS